MQTHYSAIGGAREGGRARRQTIDQTFRVKSLAMMADSCSQTADQT
jgi:hypothetical protein